MTECNHDCASCGVDGCGERTKESLLKAPNPLSNVKKIIAIMSGKGGVGKSMVTSLVAKELTNKGYKVGIMDADVTGPSIPKAFGITGKPHASDTALFPLESNKGVKIMSANLLLDDPSEPIIWRGPVIAGLVEQFWTDVAWGDIDYLLVDMPPGTGDVPLTVFQSLPIDGIIVVTTPQDLVGLIVEKAVKMAGKLDLRIVSIVENMSYFKCPNCGEVYHIFGESNIDETAFKYSIEGIDKLPIDGRITALSDQGLIEEYDEEVLKSTINELEKLNK